MREVSGLYLSVLVASDQRMLWFPFVLFESVDALHTNQQFLVMLRRFTIFLG